MPCGQARAMVETCQIRWTEKTLLPKCRSVRAWRGRPVKACTIGRPGLIGQRVVVFLVASADRDFKVSLDAIVQTDAIQLGGQVLQRADLLGQAVVVATDSKGRDRSFCVSNP